MRNAKLRIDGGGSEIIIRDWTSTSELETNLTDALEFGDDGFKNVLIEIKNLFCSQSGGTGVGANLTLQAFNTGKIAVSTKQSRVEVSRLTGPASGNQNFFNFHNWGGTIENGNYVIELSPQVSRKLLGVKMLGTAEAGAFDLFAETKYMAFFENSAGGLPDEVWIICPPGQTINFEYRIIRRS